jgi:hypothetical protein
MASMHKFTIVRRIATISAAAAVARTIYVGIAEKPSWTAEF